MPEVKGYRAGDIDGGKFYNKDDKLRFLEDVYGEEIRRPQVMVLEKTGDMERIYQKDFRDFTMSEVRSLFETKGWTTHKLYQQYSNSLRKYIIWCKENSVIPTETIHPIENLKTTDLKGNQRFHLEYYASYEDLQDCLNTILDLRHTGAPEYETYLMARVLFDMAWVGFERDEAFTIRKEGIDEAGRRITASINGRTITNIPNEIMARCIRLRDAEGFHHYRGKVKEFLTFQESNMLFRTKRYKNDIGPDDPYSTQSYNTYMLNVNAFAKSLPITNKYCGKKMTFQGAWFSGVFFRFLEFEKKTGVDATKRKNFSQVSAYALEDFRKLPGERATTYPKNYKRWKEYFYPELCE